MVFLRAMCRTPGVNEALALTSQNFQSTGEARTQTCSKISEVSSNTRFWQGSVKSIGTCESENWKFWKIRKLERDHRRDCREELCWIHILWGAERLGDQYELRLDGGKIHVITFKVPGVEKAVGTPDPPPPPPKTKKRRSKEGRYL